MEYKYKKIGNLIAKVTEKNKDGLYSEVLGVAIEKEFMPSVANIIGTDLTKYNVLRKDRFAFNPMHVGRDEKLPIAIYRRDNPALVSPAYFMFEIKDNNILDKDYLMLILKTSNFDHLCWFRTDASVRGGLTWEDFQSIEILLPEIEEQRKIVKKYNNMKKREKTLISLKEKLLNVSKIIMNERFGNNETNAQIGDLIIENSKSKIKVGDAKKGGYPFFTSGERVLTFPEKLVDGVNVYLNTGGNFDAKIYKGEAAYSTDTWAIKGINNFTYYLYLNILGNENLFNDLYFHGSALKHLQKDDFKQMEIYKPNDKEIKAFDNIVSVIFDYVFSIEKEIELIGKMKNALIANI